MPIMIFKINFINPSPRTGRTFTWFNNHGCLWWQKTVGSFVEWVCEKDL